MPVATQTARFCLGSFVLLLSPQGEKDGQSSATCADCAAGPGTSQRRHPRPVAIAARAGRRNGLLSVPCWRISFFTRRCAVRIGGMRWRIWCHALPPFLPASTTSRASATRWVIATMASAPSSQPAQICRNAAVVFRASLGNSLQKPFPNRRVFTAIHARVRAYGS
jgi:hypothetical protein